MTEQLGMVLVLVATMGMFLWGRWRHDVVAMAALLACVVLGYVPAGQAFAGLDIRQSLPWLPCWCWDWDCKPVAQSICWPTDYCLQQPDRSAAWWP